MRANKNHNPKCEGMNCGDPNGEVRLYPVGGDSHMILCISCAAHENIFRYERGRETGLPANFPQVNWFKCKVYSDDRP